MTIINTASNLASRTVTNIASSSNKIRNSINQQQSNQESDFIIFCIFCMILMIFMCIFNKIGPEPNKTTH